VASLGDGRPAHNRGLVGWKAGAPLRCRCGGGSAPKDPVDQSAPLGAAG